MTAALTSSSTGGRESGMGMKNASSGVDATVLAAIVEQRLEAGILAAVGGLDPAHEDGVIPARIGVDGGALELGQGIFEHGDAERAHAIAYPFELFRGVRDRFGREARRDGLLILVQDVDDEAGPLGQGPVALRVVGDADEDQGRVEGHRREGAGREADGPTFLVHRGDDGHARAEVTEDTPEFVGSNHPIFVSVPVNFFKFSGTLARTRAIRFLDGFVRRTLYCGKTQPTYVEEPSCPTCTSPEPREVTSSPRSSTRSRCLRARAAWASPPSPSTWPWPSSSADIRSGSWTWTSMARTCRS